MGHRDEGDNHKIWSHSSGIPLMFKRELVTRAFVYQRISRIYSAGSPAELEVCKFVSQHELIHDLCPGPHHSKHILVDLVKWGGNVKFAVGGRSLVYRVNPSPKAVRWVVALNEVRSGCGLRHV